MRKTAAQPPHGMSPREQPAARKSLGQHFLRHESICHRIAALTQAKTADSILEIGPGPGALTRALEAMPHARLLLVEKDGYWARERQRMADAQTQVIHGDAMRFDWRRISRRHPWIIAGNLPYNVASPLIWNVVSQADGLMRAVFMVQKEVGDRLTAAPGSRQYGALSAWVQSYVQVRRAFVLGPQAFSPPPRVDSAVMVLSPLGASYSRPQCPHALGQLLRICFQQRRKQLGGILQRHGLPAVDSALAHAGISADMRPETVKPAQFQALSVFWANVLDKQGKNSFC